MVLKRKLLERGEIRGRWGGEKGKERKRKEVDEKMIIEKKNISVQFGCTDDLYLCFVNAEGGTARYSQV